MTTNNNYVIGSNYGSDSVRSLLVNANTGQKMATSVFEYPRWKRGWYCDAANNQFRQDPLDYVEGIEFTIREVLKKMHSGNCRCTGYFHKHHWLYTTRYGTKHGVDSRCSHLCSGGCGYLSYNQKS